MKFKKEYLDKDMFLLGRQRSIKHIDIKLYPILYKQYPFLFECKCDDCLIDNCKCKCHKKKK